MTEMTSIILSACDVGLSFILCATCVLGYTVYTFFIVYGQEYFTNLLLELVSLKLSSPVPNPQVPSPKARGLG